jgi:hypothetical protein
MKLKYTVHRISQHSHDKLLELADGSRVTAAVVCHVVELVPIDQDSEASAIKLAFPEKPRWVEGDAVEFTVQEGA